MAMFTATRLQVATYLLGVCPFSIAFLVFLNSSVSFVITDLIGDDRAVGNAVGNLGFADELIALVACPFWGLLSDRIGVRWVCVIGYAIICLALILFVQAKNVYPQLLLGRLFFSLGGAAASTMVTAVLPTMSYTGDAKSGIARSVSPQNGHAQASSITSELTITPARFQSTRDTAESTSNSYTASVSRVAGFVGMFTGLGALLALFVFLPLPASFQKHGITPGRALQYSYYIVALVALTLSVSCFLGLRKLKSDAAIVTATFTANNDPPIAWTERTERAFRSYANKLLAALKAGFYHSDIGIGYAGGFVARASSVGISLFIPLLVNAMFTESGLCHSSGSSDNPTGLPDIKRRCPRAYIVAAELTGVSQMVALITAPVFGYWSAKTKRKSMPLSAAAISGIIGYPLFATQFDPDDSNKGARAAAFIAVCLIGFSQIGAIVCSLASLGSGVLISTMQKPVRHSIAQTSEGGEMQADEHVALLGEQPKSQSLTEIKGSVAGVYSFFGGAAILVLTKAGGSLFDTVSFGAPFYIMAGFNAILLLVNAASSLFTSSATRGF